MPKKSTLDILQEAWKRFTLRLGIVRTEASKILQEMDQEEREQKEKEILSRIRKV